MSSPTWAVRRPSPPGCASRPRRPATAIACSTSAAARSRTTPSSPSGRASTSASTSSRTPQPSCAARSRRCPSPDASFDLVLCTQVLEHCDDPAQAVRELRRVTAPGRSRPRLDARRPGLPPVAAGLLALDARRAAAALRGERRLGVGRRAGGRRDGLLPRDAARHLRRDRAAPDSSRPRARVAAEPGRQGARRARALAARAASRAR